MDWFTKTCLVMIVLLLAVIAFRPILFPQAVEAAHKYKYVAVQAWSIPQPSLLDKYAADGWELAGSYMVDINNGAVLIFRK
jgi:hypothetical protein